MKKKLCVYIYTPLYIQISAAMTLRPHCIYTHTYYILIAYYIQVTSATPLLPHYTCTHTYYVIITHYIQVISDKPLPPQCIYTFIIAVHTHILHTTYKSLQPRWCHHTTYTHTLIKYITYTYIRTHTTCTHTHDIQGTAATPLPPQEMCARIQGPFAKDGLAQSPQHQQHHQIQQRKQKL